MKALLKFFYLPSLLMAITFMFFSSFSMNEKERIIFSYQAKGLTERQAATHLLNRFTYGPRPGDVDAVVKIGLENWFKQQLSADLSDDSLKLILSQFDAIDLSNAQASETFPKSATVLSMAIKDGYIDKDSINKGDLKDYREKVGAYMRTKGIKPPRELFRQFISQKIYRATYSNNQLKEVLTDFWFNHFNVSLTKNDCAIYIPAYERDVIRPNSLGQFSNLLIATAQSPAMLFYLDNFSSSGASEQINLQMKEGLMNNIQDPNKKETLQKLQVNKKNQGLNENYAREVMELHTLGVDGGYTQADVTQAAKVLTGWTIFPFNENGPGAAYRKVIDRIGEDKLIERGLVHHGDFMFTPTRHDTGEKTVLGKRFAANGGYEEGVDLLQMLAHHPATAKFISKKLAVRFVNDNPQQSLIDKMAKTFLDKNGDIKQVLITMVNSPEFWSKEAITEKTKSPFELAISSLRALDATITQPYQVYNWVDKMGQKMYYYQAPTGFPDKGQYWINTGALLNRMNFGLALTANKIPGVKVDLAALNQNREPESSTAALTTYGKMIMPERDLRKSIERLTPMLNDPELANKVGKAAEKSAPKAMVNNNNDEDMMMSNSLNANVNKVNMKKAYSFGDHTMLAQVVGVIIGSPEFQKR